MMFRWPLRPLGLLLITTWVISINTIYLFFSTSSTSHKPYMTVSPVNGLLYLSDFMNHRVIRVATMGPVRVLERNYITVVGNGEECTPGAIDRCGDGSAANNARLSHPKGNKDNNRINKDTNMHSKKIIDNLFMFTCLPNFFVTWLKYKRICLIKICLLSYNVCIITESCLIPYP